MTTNCIGCLISTDEGGGAAALGGLEAACDRGQSLWGYPQIIDVANERQPKIIAKLARRAAEHAPADGAGRAAEAEAIRRLGAAIRR